MSKISKESIRYKCRICGKDSVQELFIVNSCGIGICRNKNCEVIQLVQSDNTPIFEYKKSYFDTNKYNRSSALLRENERRKKIVEAYCDVNSRILDAGCANGEFVNHMRSIYNIYGCDISAEAIENGKKRFPQIADRISCCKLEELVNANEYYDVVCLWDVIEHILFPNEIFDKISNIINEEGVIVLSTPNIGATFAKLLKSRWPFMTPPEHVVFFDKKNIINYLNSKKFEVIDWSTKGKWVNLGFVLYKFNRVSKVKIPKQILKCFQNGILSKINVYVPTGDIQYVVAKYKG